ncbi:hypothetical protein [Vibrio neptunius]|uniref:Uncharacterized protein n=1 Tax=Vibrio neptunius TaxID=170651 RepID=A0ABS3A038_9VIBR|nr:hypothetical protein [Vibrio neptunius]MBN3492882.1 hypothetical protein [Vibrio neptunius]MBN3515400.1 hypothetical protein [Vibrio neptunius]MBN3549414.1 hypothetical protein [Vibrio neptunius]MBN3577683.1 hypothetical protein [Vibrio neptunius]MCH9871347.1 hypothetical protein [Vibrio neptunius]
MISNVTGNIVTITFTTFIFSSSILHASESEMGMKFNNNIASVRVCENEICRNIYLEYSGLNDFIDIKKLSTPYENYHFISDTFSGVNECGKIYYLNKSKDAFVYIKDQNMEEITLCNLKQSGDYIIDNNRSSALETYESVWKINNHKLLLNYEDKIVGDFYIKRKTSKEEFLVSNEKDALKRERLHAKVTTERSYFYDKDFNRLGSYVIDGDEVNVTEYYYDGETEWAFSKYNNTIGYLKKDTLLVSPD